MITGPASLTPTKLTQTTVLAGVPGSHCSSLSFFLPSLSLPEHPRDQTLHFGLWPFARPAAALLLGFLGLLQVSLTLRVLRVLQVGVPEEDSQVEVRQQESRVYYMPLDWRLL